MRRPNRREMLFIGAWPWLGHAAPTPESRADSLRRLLDDLCTKLGPRPSGSKEYDAGAAIVERELTRTLPIVRRDWFQFRRWVLAGEAALQVEGRPLEAYVADNSPGTPREGVRGILRKSGNRYEVKDKAGNVVVRAGVSEFGRAIVTSHSGQDGIPLFNVGRQDVDALDEAVRRSARAEARAQVKWIPRARTSNVVGTLPGDSKEEILIVAHADTKYNTPGAHDNTASLIAMLQLAEAWSGKRPKRTIRFLATACEELAFLGAKHYAAQRKAQGTLGDIKVCINLDSLTYGPNLQINTTDRKLSQTILDIHRDLGLRSEPKVFERDDTMDAAPFGAAGARTVHLNSRGDDARTLPLWHRPEDRAETIKPEFVESSFRVLLELTGRLQNAW